MKTAVSLPDATFAAADELAKRLRLSRSELYAKAIAAFVAKHRGRGVTELLNQVYGEDNAASELDPAIVELQRRSIARTKR